MRFTESLRRLGAGLALAVLVFMSSPDAPRAADTTQARDIRHVFVIVLENEGYETTFGPNSPAPYLNELTKRGALLQQYYGTGHASLDNYIAMISGQAPNPVTQGDCRDFVEFEGAGTAPDGQAIGHGCVYPARIKTMVNQLEEKKLSWKAYQEDMGNNPVRENAACGHPEIGEHDRTQRAEQGDQYATRHNPFVYFHAIIDTPACQERVVGLAALHDDLKREESTPNFSFITPNLCHDGHDGGSRGNCVDGEPGGLVSADRFLHDLVPEILASPAFQHDGLLIVTFDEADLDIHHDPDTKAVTVEGGDATACCDEKPGPNIGEKDIVFGTPDRGPGIIGPGGGRIGAVLLSAAIAPGTVSSQPYNHYSLLRSLEDIFGLDHLGYAGQAGLTGFGTDVFPKKPH